MHAKPFWNIPDYETLRHSEPMLIHDKGGLLIVFEQQASSASKLVAIHFQWVATYMFIEYGITFPGGLTSPSCTAVMVSDSSDWILQVRRDHSLGTNPISHYEIFFDDWGTLRVACEKASILDTDSKIIAAITSSRSWLAI